MHDLLKMDFINSLPQPLLATLYGDKDCKWEINDIDVETGLLRINVCGKLQIMHIGDVNFFTDMNGDIHDADDFYNEKGG